MIPLIIKNILEGKHLPVYGDGSNVRDWLYVEDHCKAIDLVVREGKDGEVYNVGGHNEKTNLEIVKLTISTIHRLMAEKPEYRQVLKKKVKDENGNISIDWINEDLITFVKDRLGHDQRYAIDPTKITNALGPAEIIRVTTKRCMGNDSQLTNIPIAIRTPINSILREVSPNMLFNFLPLYIFTIRFQVRK